MSPTVPPRVALPLDERFLRRLESLALVSHVRGHGNERGERSSSIAGSGVTFATHRAYSKGDDFRFVDWKVFARSERLYVKQYEEERDLAVHLLLDCSASMGASSAAHGDKLAYAKQLAAALGYIALVNLDRVSVQPYALEPAASMPVLRGRARALVLLRYLSTLRADGGTDLRAAARAVCARARGSGLSFVLSDGFDEAGLLAGVDLLRHRKLAPVVLLLTDVHDAAPTLQGELTLVDSESGESRTLHVDAHVLARYRAAYNERLAALRGALSTRRVPVLTLDVGVPFESSVLSLLRRRGVVR